MGQADDAIAYARAQIGKPYKWAAKGPDAFDCSGLIVAAYAHANPPIRLTHWTGALITTGKPVTRGELQPGDLVFPDSGHVQLFVGGDQIIEAPEPGQNVRQGPMWGFIAGRRIITDGLPGKLAATAAGVLQELPGPFSAAAGVADVLRPVGVAAFNLASGKWWSRVGMGMLGAFLIGIGILYLNRRPIMAVASSVTGQVASVGNTLIQGAAFGFGAGKAGVGGAVGGGPSSAVPATAVASRTPQPPAPANRAVVPAPARGSASANDPVTAFVMSPGPTYAPQSPGGTFYVARGTVPESVMRAERRGRKKPLSEVVPPDAGIATQPRRKKK